MDKLENMHYVVIGVTTMAVLIFTVVMRLDMPDYQSERVGFMDSFVVTFAWLDFMGDATWTYQRFYAYEFRGETNGKVFGICSLIVLCISTALITYAVLVHVILKHKGHLRQEKFASSSFITVILLSWTDPEIIIFFPWERDAYTNTMQNALPNQDAVQVTCLKLLENIPEFFIQVAYFASGEQDAFTAANLTLTLCMVFYFAVGRFLVMALGENKIEPQPEHQEPELELTSNQDRSYPSVLIELRHVLTTHFGVDASAPTRPSEFVEEAQREVNVEDWDALGSTREKVFALAKQVGIETKVRSQVQVQHHGVVEAARPGPSGRGIMPIGTALDPPDDEETTPHHQLGPDPPGDEEAAVQQDGEHTARVQLPSNPLFNVGGAEP